MSFFRRVSSFTEPGRVLLAIAACLLLASEAGAQCPPTIGLPNGAPVIVPFNPSFYSLSGGPGRWSAVGVRPNPGSNWDLDARDDIAPFPICWAFPFAFSTEPTGVDFLVTDWRWRPAQVDFVGVSQAFGGGATVEFEQAFFELQQNRPYQQVVISEDDVLNVREAALAAGHKVWFEVWPSTGFTGLKFYLFAPSTSGTGWQPRSSALLEQTLVDGGGNQISYTPSVDGHYAVVITNEDGVAGNFYYVTKECP